MLSRRASDSATHRRATLAGVSALALLLGGCSSGEPTATPTTITVTVDGPTAGAGNVTTNSAASVPTVAATPTATPTTPATPTTSAEPGWETYSIGPARGAIRSYDDAAKKIQAAKQGVTEDSFVSPSGNIFCAFENGDTGIACELAEGAMKPPNKDLCPPGGGATTVNRVRLNGLGFGLECASDTIRTQAPVLQYGFATDLAGGKVRCMSQKDGVTCIDTLHEHGFWIARGSLVTF